jgi:Flp pilus assembly protein TadG
MKSNKGQALVEFILILPVMLMMIFCVVDFTRVFTLKTELENVTSDVVEFYQNGKTYEEIKNVMKDKINDNYNIDISTNGEYATVTLSKTIEPITPGLSLINEDVFDVSVKRVIRNE